MCRSDGGEIMRENLKKARREAGMTQQQVADKLDIGLRYYKSFAYCCMNFQLFMMTYWKQRICAVQ